MGENSGIAWTTHTFNPWVGCQRVSPGCEHCYAEGYDKRVGGGIDPKDGVKKLRWGAKAPRVRTTVGNWNKPLKWNKASKEAGRRDRVFCSSLADVFEDRAELVPWRKDLFALIAKCPDLDWLLLTKRPENIARMLPADFSAKTWPNVWLGTTVEDQKRANERIPYLVGVDAAVRFLSCEPLLEAVDLSKWLDEDATGFIGLIDWVIIGGESGSDARAFDLAWVRSLINQCRDGGRAEAVPFVKQMGHKPVETRRCDIPACNCGGTHVHPVLFEDSAYGGEPDEWPVDLRVREFPSNSNR